MNRRCICIISIMLFWSMAASTHAQAPPLPRIVSPPPKTAPASKAPKGLAPLPMPVKVDDAGRIVLRERIDISNLVIEKKPAGESKPDAMSQAVRDFQRGQAIQRVLKPGTAHVFDAEGQPVADEMLRQRLQRWTPVFVEYSTASEPSKDLLTWMNLFKPDSLLLMAPKPVLNAAWSGADQGRIQLLMLPKPVSGAAEVKVIDTPMPSPPACIMVSRAGSNFTFSLFYIVIKPVWETRTKDVTYQVDGETRVKTMAYKVCKLVPENRVKKGDLDEDAMLKRIQRLDGTPIKSEELDMLFQEPRLILDPQGARPLHTFYRRAYTPDTLMAIFEPTNSPAIEVAREFGRLTPLTSATDPLKLLSLSANQRKDFGDEQLGRLKEAKNIVHLNLDQSTVTDAGLTHLQAFDKLDNLSLNHTAVTDAGLEHLANIKTLRNLHLTGTRCTPEGIEKLKLAIPGLNVIAVGSMPRPARPMMAPPAPAVR